MVYATKKSRRKRLTPEKAAYRDGFPRAIWRVIDGAVRDGFTHHPDYLTQKGAHGAAARRSVVKRATGAVLSYLAQAKQGRSG